MKWEHVERVDHFGSRLTIYLDPEELLGLIKTGQLEQEWGEPVSKNGVVIRTNELILQCPLTKVGRMRAMSAVVAGR